MEEWSKKDKDYITLKNLEIELSYAYDKLYDSNSRKMVNYYCGKINDLIRKLERENNDI